MGEGRATMWPCDERRELTTGKTVFPATFGGVYHEKIQIISASKSETLRLNV